MKLSVTTIREITGYGTKMSDPERYHRNDPERSAPNRSMGQITSPPGASSAPPIDPWKVRTPLFRADRAEEDPMGVHSAYRVMHDYLREGSRSAEQAANRWGQAAPPGSHSLEDLSALAQRIVSIYADSIPVLMNLIHSLGGTLLSAYPYYGSMTSAAYGSEYARRTAFGGSPSAANAATNIVLEVSSRRRLQITVNITDPDNPRLVVPPLVEYDSTKSPLKDISFSPNSEPRRRALRIMVPDDQPAGNYTAAIVDRQTGVPGGLLYITVYGD
jgi:hypothetical protein